MALWLSLLTFFFIQPSRGQDQLSYSSGLQPQEPEWVSGPAQASLGAVADLQIPAGYHFTDADGARSLLKKMNNPAPAGILGILEPTSGDWLAVIEFSDIGHVSDASRDAMNSQAILKAIQDRNAAQNNDLFKNGGAAAGSVEWDSPPVYDQTDHSLEWAIRAKTQSGKVINHTLVLLGRHGVLDVTMIKASQGSSDLTSLKQLVKNISFKEGQAYADYRTGDATSGASLADLVVDDENPTASNQSDNAPVRAAASPFAWIYFYYYLLGGGVVVLLGLLFIKNLSKRRKHRSAHQHVGHLSAATLEVSKNGNGSNGSNELNGVKLNGLNGHNGHSSHLARRKRAANFGKFYTNMILELSSSNCEEFLSHSWNPAKPAPKTPAPVNGSNGSASDPAVVNANLELIAIQKNLIEEQRRFILQQSKLIEERRQLIEAHNRLAEQQSEDMENQFSLKLP